MSPEQAAIRAEQARVLINDPLLTEAFETLERQYVEAWKQTDALNVAGKEKLHLAVNIIGKVRQHLTRVINDGALARKQIEEIERDKKRRLFSVV